MNKTALITGITGQDGSYLAQSLLARGYAVHGMQLYSATEDVQRLHDLTSHENFYLHHGDLTDGGSVYRLLSEIKPNEIYNLGAQSHVRVSFDVPEATANINALGTLRLLEAIRNLKLHEGEHSVRFYQASSSEMFGNSAAPQNEGTPFAPLSPYATSKLSAYWYVRNYRESYGVHASNGILFNHESPVRGEEFVTRKITKAIAAIKAGELDMLKIGNLESRRDWGHAADYVEGMWMMLQQEMPDDYVLATGQSYSVRDFINTAFMLSGIALEWKGTGLDEVARDPKTNRVLVAVDPQFFRPNELHELVGDAAKAKSVLGWQSQISFTELVRDMLAYDQMSEEENKAHDRISAAE
jgi:GDPmannose 4,6-dehydratase